MGWSKEQLKDECDRVLKKLNHDKLANPSNAKPQLQTSPTRVTTQRETPSKANTHQSTERVGSSATTLNQSIAMYVRRTTWFRVGVVIALVYWIWPNRTNHNPVGGQDSTIVTPQRGNPATRGGSPTIRQSYRRAEDHPDTSNDESNDQPVGHFGTLTISVCYPATGKCYDIDADLSGTTLDRLYFPKGGWVDFDSCELDEDLTGECEDENGKTWEINGEA